MKKILFAVVAACLLLTPCFAQINAADYGKWSIPMNQGGQVAAGAGKVISVPPSFCFVNAGSKNIFPFKVSTPVKIVDATPSQTEVVSPTAVVHTGSICSFTATLSNAHNSYSITSGTAGLQESINDLPAGGIVLVDSKFQGTTAMITSATGNATVSIYDTRAAAPAWYQWDGAAYAAQGAAGGALALNINYSSASSFQPLAADLTLGAGAGKDHPNTAFLAPVMGAVHGSSLTKTGDYLAGVIGMYDLHTAASHYPKAGVLGMVADGTSDADGAVVAELDGDSGVTTAKAAFAVRVRNSTAGSKFAYGLDLLCPATDSYIACAYSAADARFSNGTHIFVGTATTRAALRSEVDAKVGHASVAIGSAYFSSAGKMYLKVADGVADTDWQRVTTSAAD